MLAAIISLVVVVNANAQTPPPYRDPYSRPSEAQRRASPPPEGQRREPSRPPGAQNGPWLNDLEIRRSADGTVFGESSVLVPSAGVPSAIRDDSGRILLVFQWFPQERELAEHFDRVAVIASANDGESWTAPTPIEVSGYPASFQRPFDPTIAATGDGRYRLFFSGGQKPVPGERGMMNGIATHSAISEDGVHYVYEPGERLAVSGRQVIDPAAIRFRGSWHLTAPAGRPQDGAFHATSRDGLNFTRRDNIPSVGGVNWTGNLIVIGDEMRFYGGGASLWWAATRTGASWSDPVRTNIARGGDPTIVRTGGGAFLAIYVAQSAERARRRENFPEGMRR